MTGWDRVEAMVCDTELSGGLEMRVADPLWLLARQWQVGEFHGDDAAQPAAARVTGRSVPLVSFRAGSCPPGAETAGVRPGRPVPIPEGRPLETVAEATAEPGFGTAHLHAAVRAGRRLTRLLHTGGLPAAADALRAEFTLAPPDHAVTAGGLGRSAAELLVRLGLDGAGLARADPARVTRALAARVRGDDLTRAEAIVHDWRTWYRARGGFDGEPGWDEERVEYTFSVAARGPKGEITLRAPEHRGGHLDWHSFDLVTGEQQAHGLDAAAGRKWVKTAVPTPVRYTGMPASRLWEFEDGQVHFGDLDAGPADLARLMVAELATVYGDDMFSIPVAVPVGSLTELRSVEVIDTFGGHTTVPSTAMADSGPGKPPQRAWRLFELTGDEVNTDHPSPWLLIPPTLAGGLDGPVLERVALTRDEAANLAWGIEHLVEGPLGRAVDRARAFSSSSPAAPPPTGEPAAPGDRWRYRLEATAPPWWIPLLPERIDPDAAPADLAAQVRLRRARMQAWALLDPEQVGPKSELLDPRRPRLLAEEQVAKDGLIVERAWQSGRWHDGSMHVWLAYRVTPGRAEPSSGTRWDLLDRTPTGPHIRRHR
ncbi:hypothetical protein EDD29_5183 [Actinocorallia herbida]|uniref:Uncharacterized protein n=1 Tax=Actinocorallia herbida TaxID=58109 RepID=A0A3N1D258_9ACTN|nr:hypothetical protein [Actinocorallia herbida]ROO87570.1 hypothetical protein EDD29_5183 [Actinocorallia herbida]